MNKLWYATTNPGKFESLQHHLTPTGIELAQASLHIPEPRLDSIERTAEFKAMFAFQALKQPVVANDAGFFVRALKGFPGTFVNFALDTINVDGLLRLADGTDRVCEFRHALAYEDGIGEIMVFADRVKGIMPPEARGVYDPAFHWSALVTIFIPDGQTKTLGEMARDEYNDWSENLAPKPRHFEKFLTWYRANRSPLPAP